MLVEFGFVQVSSGDGREFTFTPSFKNIAKLGAPVEIVDLFASLHGSRAYEDAPYVLMCLCDQDDPTQATGFHDGREKTPTWVNGFIDRDVQVMLARHLMRHGIAGKAKPDKKGTGDYAKQFSAAEFISSARVHLGLSAAEAEALSMTEFQTMLELKFPNDKQGGGNVPSREEYKKFMDSVKGRKRD